MNTLSTTLTSEEILQKTFGYSSFRRGQKEIIENILSGNDVMAILPTGGAQSLCPRENRFVFKYPR